MKCPSFISPIIQMPRRPSIVGGAAIENGFSLTRCQTIYVVLMHCVWFTTPKRIHGLWHWEREDQHEVEKQLLFVGYECAECREIFLLPDSAKDERTLMEAMQHKCMEEPV